MIDLRIIIVIEIGNTLVKITGIEKTKFPGSSDNTLREKVIDLCNLQSSRF